MTGSGIAPAIDGVSASVPATAVGSIADFADPKACLSACDGSFEASAIPELNASSTAAPLLVRVESGPSFASENGNSFLSLDNADRRVSYGAETAERMPEAIVVIINLPLAKAPVTKPRNPESIEENALDAAPRTVDHADEANPTRLANGAFSHPMADVAIERMPDQADDANPVTCDHADPATPATQRNGADTNEYADEPMDATAFQPELTMPVIPFHAELAICAPVDSAPDSVDTTCEPIGFRPSHIHRTPSSIR